MEPDFLNACLLITVEPKSIFHVADEIQKISSVKVVFPAFGQWDIIVWLQSKDFQSLTNDALEINELANVISTETLLQLRREME